MKKKGKIQVEFGNRVRFLRKSARLTQDELAERSDLHPTYIGQVERGERNLSLSCIEKISKGLGVDLDELFIFHAKKRAIGKEKLKHEIRVVMGGMNEKSLRIASKVLKSIKEESDK
jgi:transcriptional regulator with XRE-family HTH domain